MEYFSSKIDNDGTVFFGKSIRQVSCGLFVLKHAAPAKVVRPQSSKWSYSSPKLFNFPGGHHSWFRRCNLNRMNIFFVHNPKAGDGDHSTEQFVNILEKGGHKVRDLSIRKDDIRKALGNAPDLVIAAGGDGTVRKVSLALADTGIPMSILPIGTVNNVARSLGLVELGEAFLSSIENGESAKFDVGAIYSPEDEGHFIEGVGIGLISDFIYRAEKEFTGKTPSEEEVFTMFYELAEACEPIPIKMKVDGVDASGEYLFVEVMNIRSLGPALRMNVESESNDGVMECIAARESDRDVILAYLRNRQAGIEEKLPLTKYEFRSLEIGATESRCHRDDKLFKGKELFPARLEVNAGSLTLWLPR